MKRRTAAPNPPGRQDGQQTRQQLLAAAGAVFAEQGYAQATSKEICERAQANIAAVNYHFGGKDGLYAAVLEEAHQRLVSLDAVAAAARSTIEPHLKLRVLLRRIVGEITRRDRQAWELRVLSRELLSPSPLMDRLIKNQIAPKAKFARAIIGEIMKLPEDHAAVSRSVINVMAPCLVLLITSRTLQQKIAPALDYDAEALTDHMLTYALAGMKAVAKQEAVSG